MIQTATSEAVAAVETRMRRVLKVHFDPVGGTPYWLAAQERLRFNVVDQVRSIRDVARLGTMTDELLRNRPVTDLIPRRFHDRLDEMFFAQTGGTTGRGGWTAYRQDEFVEAFVAPFEAAASHVGFPRGGFWLYIGPTGPHIIGRAAMRIARSVGSPAPFCVDFDPRWAKKLPEESFARRRYIAHIIDQATDVIETQDVSVLFATPAVIEQLTRRMTTRQRERIRGVHYGGMALEGDLLCRLQTELLAEAVHLSGYGNTLFGCCPELRTDVGRPLDYYPYGDRLWFDIVRSDDAAEEPRGRVSFSRFDESMLLINLIERDAAELVEPPDDAPAPFRVHGIRNPGPIHTAVATRNPGLY